MWTDYTLKGTKIERSMEGLGLSHQEEFFSPLQLKLSLKETAEVEGE